MERFEVVRPISYPPRLSFEDQRIVPKLSHIQTISQLFLSTEAMILTRQSTLTFVLCTQGCGLRPYHTD